MKVVYSRVLDDILEAKAKADAEMRKIKCVRLTEDEVGWLVSEMPPVLSVGDVNPPTNEEVTRRLKDGGSMIFGVLIEVE